MDISATPTDPRAFKSFAEFYPFYLTEHSNRTCRRLHFVGSTLSLLCLAWAVATRQPSFLLVGLLCGYGFAWVGPGGLGDVPGHLAGPRAVLRGLAVPGVLG